MRPRLWWLGLWLPLVAASWLESADFLLRGLAFQMRGALRPPPELVIVDADQASVTLAERLTPAEIAASPLWRRMGSWPWPRALQAELAALVLEQGARQVVFTVLYPHPSSFGAADDQAFAQRLAPWADRVVLAAGYSVDQVPGVAVDLVQLRQPIDLFRRAGMAVIGLDALLEGADGRVAALPGLQWQRQALAGLPPPHPPALAYAAARRQPPLLPLGIDFPGPAGTVPVVPAWQLLDQPPGFWRDRLVLFGRTPSRLADRRETPFGPVSSLELQAAALSTVLQGRGFSPLPRPLDLLLLLAWGLIAARLLGRSTAAAGTVLQAGLLASTALVVGGVAWSAGCWLPVTALLASPLAGGGLRASGQWRRESRERAYLRQVLARRISPALLADILRQPGPLGTQLGGSRARCVVLFTDLVGFTPLSAQLAPAELFALLNRYFEAIAAAVIAEDGLLDKFIGDALMAEFGVPRSRGEQQEARAALRAALAMQHSLEQLNAQLRAQGQPSLRQGIGIHAGEVIAGNLGSSQRLEFTVVGATVNVASRLEGLTRQFPEFPILISDAVLALLPGELDVEPLGAHLLKGWPEPMQVFGVRGWRGQSPA